MIPKKLIEKLIDNDIYIYVREINEKFSGKLIQITEDDLLVVEDKYNNVIYIPLSEIVVLTERR